MSDSREDFEQAFLNQYTDFERFTTGEYMDDFLQQSWLGWQASREALEGEAIGYVVPRMLEAMQAGKYCGISISDEQKAGDIAVYTHPASADVPKKWRTVMKELADDLESEIEARRSGDLDRRIERDLIVVKEARVLLDEQEPGQ